MHPEALIATLKSLKLFGMAQAIDDLAQQNSPAWQSRSSTVYSKPRLPSARSARLTTRRRSHAFRPIVTWPALTLVKVWLTRL
jgi:hypothetical protein